MPNRLPLLNLLIALLLLASGAAMAADDGDLEKVLNDRYKNQILVLRHPVKPNHLDLDQTGEFREGQPETWTLYGRILVESFKIAPDQLEVDGTRVVYRFEQRPNQLVPHKTKTRFTLRIRLHKPLESQAETIAVLGKVFALTSQDAVKSVPKLWRVYMAGEMGLHSPDFDEKNPKELPAASPEESELEEDLVQKIGSNVKPPKIKYQPEPEFSEEARNMNFEGVAGFKIVVDRKGAVANIQLVRPAGMGLDEKAAEGVKAWRFEPATLNGKPVAVAVYVEVDFRLSGGRR